MGLTGIKFHTNFTASNGTYLITSGSLWSQSYTGVSPLTNVSELQSLTLSQFQSRIGQIYDATTGSLSTSYPNWKTTVSRSGFVTSSYVSDSLICPPSA